MTDSAWRGTTVVCDVGRGVGTRSPSRNDASVYDCSMSNGDAPENLLYPACFRDATEIRAVKMCDWLRIRDELDHA